MARLWARRSAHTASELAGERLAHAKSLVRIRDSSGAQAAGSERIGIVSSSCSIEEDSPVRNPLQQNRPKLRDVGWQGWLLSRSRLLAFAGAMLVALVLALLFAEPKAP